MRSRINKSPQLAAAFEIGLKPVARDRFWLQPFDGLASYLAQKAALFDQKLDLVFGDIGGTVLAQQEVFNLISNHLTVTFPRVYGRSGGQISISIDDLKFQIDPAEVPPLLAASKLIADDLVIMRKTEQGWRLAVGSVCFPSVWKLPDKLGRVMADIHAPVPGFGEGTRHATMIERIFDNLPVGKSVTRQNWSIHAIEDLHLPEQELDDIASVRDAARLFLRGEIQTLTKLSSGADIFFTIGVFVDQLSVLENDPDKTAALATQLAALNDQELRYKGLTDMRSQLLTYLQDLSASQCGTVGKL